MIVKTPEFVTNLAAAATPAAADSPAADTTPAAAASPAADTPAITLGAGVVKRPTRLADGRELIY